MAKTNMTITIDDYLMRWLRNQEYSASLFVNETLKRIYNIETANKFKDLKDAELYLTKLEDEKQQSIKNIDNKITIMKGLIERIKAKQNEIQAPPT